MECEFDMGRDSGDIGRTKRVCGYWQQAHRNIQATFDNKVDVDDTSQENIFSLERKREHEEWCHKLIQFDGVEHTEVCNLI